MAGVAGKEAGHMTSTASAAQDSRTSGNISTGAGRSEGRQRTWSSTSMARNPPTSTAPAAHSGSAAAPCSARLRFKLWGFRFTFQSTFSQQSYQCSHPHMLLAVALPHTPSYMHKSLTVANALMLATCVSSHGASMEGCMPADSCTACSASKTPSCSTRCSAVPYSSPILKN